MQIPYYLDLEKRKTVEKRKVFRGVIVLTARRLAAWLPGWPPGREEAELDPKPHPEIRGEPKFAPDPDDKKKMLIKPMLF